VDRGSNRTTAPARSHIRTFTEATIVAQAGWGGYAGWFLREQQGPIAVRKVYEEIEGRLPPPRVVP
jgi:hypothetical protein